MTFDTAVLGGDLVGPGGRRRAHLYIGDGRIAAITHDRLEARRIVDATGLLVMPGMVDAHVHLMDPGAPEREDFPTGTAAAARAGVTTIVEHTHSSPVRNVEDLRAKLDWLDGRARIDYALAAHAWPGELDAIDPLWRSGVAFFKAFTTTTHGVPGHSPADVRQLFMELARVGGIALVHCEDESITAQAEAVLRAAGRADGGVLPVWRAREAELVAVDVVALLARLTHARAVIAHASHAAVVDLVQRERALGAALECETCPQYLRLREAEAMDHGGFRKFTPPARARTDADLTEMWEALRTGRISVVSSDHAPSTAAQKASGGIWDVPFGLPGLDTTLPVLLDGARLGRITYELITDVYSRGPARAYGLWPRKGELAVGGDADVVLVDPGRAWTVDDAEIVSKAGWSPFAGQTLVGRAVLTMLRGVVVAAEGQVLAEPGQGRFVPGPGARSAVGD